MERLQIFCNSAYEMAKEPHPESKEAMGKRLLLTRLALMDNIDNQAAFARQLDVSPARLNNWETGDNYLPMPEALKLVQKYTLTLAWIYQGQEADLKKSFREKLEDARQKLKDGLITKKRSKK